MAELGRPDGRGHRRARELIAPYATSIEHVEPWLTLHGLRIVYERNVRTRP